MRYAPNIAGIDGFDFRAAVAEATGTQVVLENDVNLAVLGEQWLGAGQGIDHLAFIALGTGIGAGLIVNGALLRGASGAAGELGYLPFGADPFEAESLRVGAFERVTATHGIRSAYEAATGKVLDVPSIFSAVSEGDAAAQAVLDGVARQMARAVATLGAVIAPEMVILGGSIGARPEIIAANKSELERCFPFSIHVVPSALGCAHAGGDLIPNRHNAQNQCQDRHNKRGPPPSGGFEIHRRANITRDVRQGFVTGN